MRTQDSDTRRSLNNAGAGTGLQLASGMIVGCRDVVRCGADVAQGNANGFLPDRALCPLSVGGGHRLHADAAAAFDRMAAARELCVTDSYRDYAAPVDVYERKPDLAAVPGTSNHGWGGGSLWTWGAVPSASTRRRTSASRRTRPGTDGTTRPGPSRTAAAPSPGTGSTSAGPDPTGPSGTPYGLEAQALTGTGLGRQVDVGVEHDGGHRIAARCSIGASSCWSPRSGGPIARPSSRRTLCCPLAYPGTGAQSGPAHPR